jgi:hypothetical protein
MRGWNGKDRSSACLRSERPFSGKERESDAALAI